MRRLALALFLALALPAPAWAGGTWTSSDFVSLQLSWATDTGAPAQSVFFKFTKPVRSAVTDEQQTCVQGQFPDEIHCQVGGPNGKASGSLNVTLTEAAGCADQFQFHATSGGAMQEQAPITSANQCGEPPPPPPPEEPSPPPPSDPEPTPPGPSEDPPASRDSAPRFGITVGAASNTSHVKSFLVPTLALDASFFAFSPPSMPGGVRVAMGDVNGDGRADIVTGTGSGTLARVAVYDGVTGGAVAMLAPFGGFSGGVHVAAGDVNGDGRADVIVGAASGSSHVKVLSGAGFGEIRSFFAYGTFTGGVTVAAGDVNGDGRDDIVTGAGPGAGPHVKVFDAATSSERASFFAFAPAFRGGVQVAAGDVNGDGSSDLIVGAGPAPGVGSHVKVFDGRTLGELASFFAYPGTGNGVHVGAGDVNGDGVADVITGAGASASHVKAFRGGTFAEIASFFAFPGAPIGVTVAGVTFRGAALAARTVTVRDGTAPVRAECPDGTAGSCTGTVTVSIAGASASARRRARVTLGKGRLRIRSGGRGTVRVKLNRRGRARLAKRRRIRVIATIDSRDRAGNRSRKSVRMTLRRR